MSVERELSVAVSDLFLCGTGIMSFLMLNEVKDCEWEAYGFLCISLAAFAGVIRFSGIWKGILPIHKLLTIIATNALALVCLSIFMYNDNDIVDRPTRLILTAIILIIFTVPSFFMGLTVFIELFQAVGS